MPLRSSVASVIFEAVRDNAIGRRETDFLPCESVKCIYSYPVKLILPRDGFGSSSVCKWVYPMVFGGGLVEGDTIKILCTVGSECCILWTTLSYPKVYPCIAGLDSCQECQYIVEAKGFLCILGHPVQCFERASYIQRQVFRLDSEASLILLEWTVSGRIERGERWDFTKYKSTIDVYVDDKMICREHQNMQNTEQLNLKNIMQAYDVTGMCLILGPYLNTLYTDILSELGKIDTYGEMRKPETVFAVSPVRFETGDIIHGCMIKFVSESIAEAYKKLEDIFAPLYNVLGGNPFERK